MSEKEKGILAEILDAYANGSEIFITEEGNKWLATHYASENEASEEVEAS